MAAHRLRLAAMADLGRIVALAAEFREFLELTTPDDATFASRLASSLADPNSEFVVAEDVTGALQGYLQLRFRDSIWFGREAEVEDLFVRTAGRGQGLGAALLEFALARARDCGCAVLGLQTNENNTAAVRLYEAGGLDARRARWHGGRQVWFVRELRPPQGMAG